MNNQIIVWAALHNPMIEESVAYTISLHMTKEGAEKAIEKNKLEVKKEHNEVYSKFDEDEESIPKWDSFHWWGVEKKEVEPV